MLKFYFVPRRVNVPQGVVQAVAVAVQGLGVGGALDNGIGTDKPPDSRVIIPGAVVVQAGAVQPLPGELFVGGLKAAIPESQMFPAGARSLLQLCLPCPRPTLSLSSISGRHSRNTPLERFSIE